MLLRLLQFRQQMVNGEARQHRCALGTAALPESNHVGRGKDRRTIVAKGKLCAAPQSNLREVTIVSLAVV